jgi:hypothetical protein
VKDRGAAKESVLPLPLGVKSISSPLQITGGRKKKERNLPPCYAVSIRRKRGACSYSFDPSLWTHQQISPLKPAELVDVLYQATTHYHRATYFQDAQKILGQGAGTYVDNLLYGDRVW